MATCKRCGKKGLFLKLNANGYCQSCEEEEKRKRIEEERMIREFEEEQREIERTRKRTEAEFEKRKKEAEAAYTPKDINSLSPTNKHIYVFDGTNNMPSITTQDIVIPFAMPEMILLRQFINTYINQGYKSLKMDSPQMYIEISADYYAGEITKAINGAPEKAPKLRLSFEGILDLYVNFQQLYNDNESLRSNPWAEDVLKKLGMHYVVISTMAGMK